MKRLTISLFLTIAIFSCESEKDKYLIYQGQIMEINGPDSAFVNELISIEIVFNGGTNGCAQPHHLETKQADTIFYIKAFYSVPNFPTVCPQNVPIHKLKFNFTPGRAALYIVKAEDVLNQKDTIIVTL